MLSDYVRISYRHPAKTPIQLMIDSNHLTIDCSVSYNRRALAHLPDSDATRADLIEDGIRQAWSGTYLLGTPGLPDDAQDEITVSVVFHRDGRRRPVKVGLHRLFLMPAHVISPLWRRFWGICKTGQLESIGTNWSLEQPGRMVLPTELDTGQLMRVAAHEAGHLFGLGDAYAAIYRFYYAVPGKERYMMYSNGQVQPEEINMLICAHLSGRMQFFPRRWNGRNFRAGLRADLRSRAAQLDRQIAAWRAERKRRKTKNH